MSQTGASPTFRITKGQRAHLAKMNRDLRTMRKIADLWNTLDAHSKDYLLDALASGRATRSEDR